MHQPSRRSKKLSISIEGASRRLDQSLRDALRELKNPLSRSQLKKLFEERRVLIDDNPKPASWSLSPGQHTVTVLEVFEDEISAQSLAQPSTRGSFLPIVYEDENLLVLDKQSGIPSIPLSPHETETAVGSALAHYPKLAGVGTKPLEPGILHRLDTGTSGLLAFSKNQQSFEFYRSAWRDGRVQKTYRAMVCGDASSLIFPSTHRLKLAHHIHSAKKMMVIDEREHKFRGKPLNTVTHLVRRHAVNKDFTDLEIRIETGVMHQIRCTLSYLGFPILGDPIYGQLNKVAVPGRLALHAWKLGLPMMGGSNEKGELTLVSELPSPFKQ